MEDVQTASMLIFKCSQTPIFNLPRYEGKSYKLAVEFIISGFKM